MRTRRTESLEIDERFARVSPGHRLPSRDPLRLDDRKVRLEERSVPFVRGRRGPIAAVKTRKVAERERLAEVLLDSGSTVGGFVVNGIKL
jgi:hypothetical protein